LGATSLVACESASEALTPVQLKRQRALASCLSLWRQFFSYGEILVENITSLLADIESLMTTIKRRMPNIPSPMTNIRLLMANIEILMAKITSRYGGKYSGMAKILWGRSRMAEITLRGTLGCLAYHGGG
jgi:hypothetical protein